MVMVCGKPVGARSEGTYLCQLEGHPIRLACLLPCSSTRTTLPDTVDSSDFGLVLAKRIGYRVCVAFNPPIHTHHIQAVSSHYLVQLRCLFDTVSCAIV